MNWSNASSYILRNVFGNFSFGELQNLSFVCQNWYEEIGFSWRDDLELDFRYIFNNQNVLVLKNSKRIYSNLKIDDSICFEDTAAIFKAIPLLKDVELKYVKKMELKGLSLLQIEDIFEWMGEFLETLIVSDMVSRKSFKSDRKIPAKNRSQYLKIFSKLKSFSVRNVSEEFERFFKYFENVTDLTLEHVNFYQCEELLKRCTKVRMLHIMHVDIDDAENSDFSFLESLEQLQEIVIDGPSSEIFNNYFVGFICDSEARHVFPLKLLHLKNRVISQHNIEKLIHKFAGLEDISFKRFGNDSKITNFVWNIKGLKAIRGDIFNTKYFYSFDLSPRLSLVTIDICGTGPAYDKVDCEIVSQVLKCLPNLENLCLCDVRGDISLILEQLSNLHNLKTLKIQNVRQEPSQITKFHCLELLEELQISEHDCCLELPNLKKIISEDESFFDQFQISKNIEFMEIYNILNFKNIDVIFSKLSDFQNLKTLSLKFIQIENVYEAIKYILHSPHIIPIVIDLKILLETETNRVDLESEFQRKITELSTLADKVFYISVKGCKWDFLKNGVKIVIKVKFNSNRQIRDSNPVYIDITSTHIIIDRSK